MPPSHRTLSPHPLNPPYYYHHHLSGAFAHPEHDAMPDYVDYESCNKEIMPISAAPAHKSSFVPSKWEMMKVMSIINPVIIIIIIIIIIINPVIVNSCYY